MSDSLYFSLVNNGDVDKTFKDLRAYRERMLSICETRCELNSTCTHKISNHMSRCKIRALLSIST